MVGGATRSLTSDQQTRRSDRAGTVAAVERDRDRLVYLFGDDALELLDGYDLADEADVMELVERYLPVSRREHGLGGAQQAVRTIAVRQIIDDDPPATWRAVERMRAAGLDRDRVLGQLAMAISDTLLDALDADTTPDPGDPVSALDALPLPSTGDVATALIATARAQPGIDVDSHIAATIAALRSDANARIMEPLVDRVLDHLIDGPLHWLSDDQTVVFHDTVAQRTFTHRFNEAERELGVLTVSFDLAAFGRFDTVRLADGTELDQFSVDSRHLAWKGPEGWLDDFTADDLLAVNATFEPPNGDEPIDAVVTIEVVGDAPAMSDELPIAVRAAYDREQHEHGLPVTAERLVVSLCHHQAELFTGTRPPLSEWCDAAGLQRNGNLVAHDDTVWRRDLLRRQIYEIMDLVADGPSRRSLTRAVEVLGDPDADVDEVRASLDECAEPDAIDVLADVLIPELLDPDDEHLFGSVEAPGHAFELVGRATAVARRPREVATAEYLACVLRERCGQPLAAAEHLARAVEARPRLGPLVERMGWYCFDRGDARGAMRWWRELDQAHPAASTIAAFLTPSGGHRQPGRNDPCWCGSGRKFKHCHQSVSELPALPDRVAWLCRKASLWLEHTTGSIRSLVTDLAIAWVAGDPDAEADDVLTADDEMREQFERAFADPILFDAALHEGGGFARFLRERGELLPDDEHLLATSWLTVERTVHEVVAVNRGIGMTLRNLATGDVADVRERRMSSAARDGECYCLRVVPDGDSHQIVGGAFPVRAGRESTVMKLCDDGDPFELCAWAGAQAQPPSVVHRPGMLDEIFDREAIQGVIDTLGDVDEETMISRLNAELRTQAQARWLDEKIPALRGLTPREAAADPTRREQLERLLDELDRTQERLRAAGEDRSAGDPTSMLDIYDTADIRRQLGLA